MSWGEESKPSPRPQYYFQITALPESEAPMAHRVALVGKVFPLLPRNMDGPEPMRGCEVESGLVVDVPDAICADLRHVVHVLRCAGEEQAADYWASRVFQDIMFQRSEVRVFLGGPGRDAEDTEG